MSKDELNKIDIKSDFLTYEKNNELIIFEKNILISDKINNINLNTNKFTYSINKKIISIIGNADININNKYKINSKNLIYNKNKNTLRSQEKSTLVDNEGNIIEISDFFYDHTNQVLKGIEIKVTDINQNQYYLSKGMVDLSTNELLGKDIKVSLRNDTLEIPKTIQDLLEDQLFMDLKKQKLKKVSLHHVVLMTIVPHGQLNQMK